MSFLLFINLLVPHATMAVFMCLHYCINKQRHTSFKFSSILSTVDLSKHLVTAWIIRKFIHLVNFVTFSVFFLFFGNRVWLNLYERALSGNELLSILLKETSIITGSFDLKKCLFIQCRTFPLTPYFIPDLLCLYPVRSP